MSVFQLEYWNVGDLFCGSGGGSVLWRIDSFTECDSIWATCLLDGEQREWMADHMRRNSDMHYCPLKEDVLKGSNDIKTTRRS